MTPTFIFQTFIFSCLLESLLGSQRHFKFNLSKSKLKIFTSKTGLILISLNGRSPYSDARDSSLHLFLSHFLWPTYQPVFLNVLLKISWFWWNEFHLLLLLFLTVPGSPDTTITPTYPLLLLYPHSTQNQEQYFNTATLINLPLPHKTSWWLSFCCFQDKDLSSSLEDQNGVALSSCPNPFSYPFPSSNPTVLYICLLPLPGFCIWWPLHWECCLPPHSCTPLLPSLSLPTVMIYVFESNYLPSLQTISSVRTINLSVSAHCIIFNIWQTLNRIPYRCLHFFSHKNFFFQYQVPLYSSSAPFFSFVLFCFHSLETDACFSDLWVCVFGLFVFEWGIQGRKEGGEKES